MIQVVLKAKAASQQCFGVLWLLDEAGPGSAGDQPVSRLVKKRTDICHVASIYIEDVGRVEPAEWISTISG
ncbi:hypothetical protein HYDPIDRAFT_118879 [Hydnomerulius pinastri MD-312]|uniref:Uncharacterized protein n=1 Tax=Hydnomerulius pinastri MD-312 TaxID=994086 RepID=A0A0C9V1B2_9AGAM|nr:hypothetical protein HYDPIDRAFT_118879 [Hydnomerulius pinastri MD-312]